MKSHSTFLLDSAIAILEGIHAKAGHAMQWEWVHSTPLIDPTDLYEQLEMVITSLKSHREELRGEGDDGKR